MTRNVCRKSKCQVLSVELPHSSKIAGNLIMMDAREGFTHQSAAPTQRTNLCRCSYCIPRSVIYLFTKTVI